MKIMPDQKVFCSFAFTGEDEAAVEARMNRVVEVFDRFGIVAYCNLYDDAIKGLTSPQQYMLAARSEIRNHDVLFVLQASDRRSEGQLVEVGMALEREMPIVLAQHESAVGKTYLDTLADMVFTWTDVGSLVSGIESIT